MFKPSKLDPLKNKHKYSEHVHFEVYCIMFPSVNGQERNFQIIYASFDELLVFSVNKKLTFKRHHCSIVLLRKEE